MDRIQEFKSELAEMVEAGMGPLWTHTDIVDTETGELIAKHGTDIPDEKVDRVLWLVLVDDKSKYCILDDGIYVTREHGGFDARAPR